jgi:glycosyltransferase involved in cell wall biosynthesis
MNVLVIPSWYPSRSRPLAGTFCREQAQALAACTDVNVVVCDWGQQDGALSFRQPLEAVRNLVWWLGSRRQIRRQGGRFWELFEPTLQWSPHLPGGGQKRILAAIRRSYTAACRQVGRIDLIHAHVCCPGGFLASELAQETGVPYLLTEHWSRFPGPLANGRPKPEIESALQRAAAVVSVSQPAAAKIRALGFPRVRVIPNVVDESRFVVRPFPAGKFRFFSMGGITRGKGFDLLLLAISQWSPSADEVEFVIAGEGAQTREFQALAEELGVDGLVRWVGAVSRDDAPRYYQACHAFVLPSRHESFGVVFAEAIASGRPVIATRCGGPEDIVNETNGRLIQTENIPQLAAALAQMKQQHTRYDPSAIRDDFMRRFSRPAVTAQIRDLYLEVAGHDQSQ